MSIASRRALAWRDVSPPPVSHEQVAILAWLASLFIDFPPVFLVFPCERGAPRHLRTSRPPLGPPFSHVAHASIDTWLTSALPARPWDAAHMAHVRAVTDVTGARRRSTLARLAHVGGVTNVTDVTDVTDTQEALLHWCTVCTIGGGPLRWVTERFANKSSTIGAARAVHQPRRAFAFAGGSWRRMARGSTILTPDAFECGAGMRTPAATHVVTVLSVRAYTGPFGSTLLHSTGS